MKTLTLSITVVAPFITRSSAPGPYGVDAVFARKARRGVGDGDVAILPFSHVKGRLREAWTELADELGAPIDDWLGPASQGNRREPAGAFTAQRGAVEFTDFTGPVIPKGTKRVRIQIDANLRSVKEHMLQVIESPFAPGEKVTFRGEVRFPDLVDGDRLKKALRAGLYWTQTVGAMRTSGFGRIDEVSVEEAAADPAKLTDPPGKALHLWLTTSDMVCVTEARGGENLFVSGEVISGGITKGALASTWLRNLGLAGARVATGIDPSRPELAEQFANLRFRHARLSDSQATVPVVMPLSIARYGRQFRDVAMAEGIQADGSEAAAFSVDWKDEDWERIGRVFRTTRAARELRVRTAIDPERRRAQQEQLFGYEMVAAKERQGWHLQIDFQEQLPAQARQQLIDLMRNGIGSLGKTKARFAVSTLEQSPVPPVEEEQRHDIYILALQTPALLGDPGLLTEGRSGDGLLTAYRNDFDDISGHSLFLERFFARQFLQGGLYLYKRFLAGGAKAYQPYLLTAPGSVFVLRPREGREEAASKCIEDWKRLGLRAPQWVQARYARSTTPGGHWDNNPYVRENGFGEVAVNLKCHFVPEIEIPEKEDEHVQPMVV